MSRLTLRGEKIRRKTYRGGTGRLGRNDLGQRVRARRVPEANGVAGEVNLVGNVVPHVRVPSCGPLAHAANVPAQQAVAGAGFAADETVLHLGEVALEEADLVLVERRWSVRVRTLHAEVVEHLALVDGGRRLGDQLRAAHRLAIPVRGAVDGELGALLGAGVGGILVGWVQVDVFRHCAGAVDVVLVGTDLVAE